MPQAIPAIAALATAAGAAVSYEGAQESRSKMNQAASDQVAAQEALQKRATPIYQQNLQQSSAANTQKSLDAATQAALAKTTQLQSLPLSTQSISYAPESKAVDARTTAELARARQANAAVQQYPALQASWRLGNQNVGNQLGNIGAISSGLSSIFPAQLAMAQQSDAGLQGLGSLIGAAGSLAGTYGATRPNGIAYDPYGGGYMGYGVNAP